MFCEETDLSGGRLRLRGGHVTAGTGYRTSGEAIAILCQIQGHSSWTAAMDTRGDLEGTPDGPDTASAAKP